MKWSKKYLEIYEKPYSDIPDKIFEQVKDNIEKINTSNPVATIAIITFNDETRLLSCLWSLSENKTQYPFEIIGVNNASTDNSEEIFKRTGVKYYNEEKKGQGFARQCALENANGTYYFCIDSDTIYPPNYIDVIINKFEKSKAIAVCSYYSIIYRTLKEKYFYLFYELFRDFNTFLLLFNRPCRAVRGAVFAFNTAKGKEIGFRVEILRGEDGSMAFQLSEYGKIVFVYNRKARAITISPLFLGSNSSMTKVLIKKIKYELSHAGKYFKKLKELKDQESNIRK